MGWMGFDGYRSFRILGQSVSRGSEVPRGERLAADISRAVRTRRQDERGRTSCVLPKQSFLYHLQVENGEKE